MMNVKNAPFEILSKILRVSIVHNWAVSHFGHDPNSNEPSTAASRVFKDQLTKRSFTSYCKLMQIVLLR